MQALSVFEYRSAKRFFLDFVEQEKRATPSFSIRKWAKDMGMPGHALLVLILQGKRNLTLKQIPSLTRGLRLSTPERLYFQALIQLENTKTEEEKELIRSWLIDLNPGKTYQVKEVDEYLVISHWIHMAILAFSHSQEGLVDVSQLIKRFQSKVPAIEIHSAFERLKELGLLFWDTKKEKYLPTFQRVTTRDDVLNKGSREYHKQSSRLAAEAIEHIVPELREFQSFAMNVPVSKISKLKEMMRRFRTQVETELREMDDVSIVQGEELYQMNLHFFRLTEKPWSESKVQTGAGARKPQPSNELAMEDQNQSIEDNHETIN